MSFEDSSDRASHARDAAPVWRRNEPDSPCVSLCVMHPTAKVCAGCGRTAEEIASWSKIPPEVRAAVILALPERLAALDTPANRPSRRRRRNRRSD